MNNQLIIYKPKKNTKKIIIFILLGIILSICIFLFSAGISSVYHTKNKWNDSNNFNIQTLKDSI